MRILYAEDEKPLAAAICEILKMEGYDVDEVSDGQEAIDHLSHQVYDVAVLDIMMPKADGITVLKFMRDRGDYTPVLLLTAKAEVDDRIAGLTAGADDYLGKPFSAGELLARLSALLRRARTYRPAVMRFGDLTLDAASGEVKTACTSLRLSAKESKLLQTLIQAGGRTLRAEELMQGIWTGENGPAALSLYLSYLRDKLRGIRSCVQITDNGEGYCLTQARAS